jgi:hypothetical protein
MVSLNCRQVPRASNIINGQIKTESICIVLFSNAIVIRLFDIYVHLIEEQSILDSSGVVRSNHPVMGKILEGVKVIEVAQYVFVPRP